MTDPVAGTSVTQVTVTADVVRLLSITLLGLASTDALVMRLYTWYVANTTMGFQLIVLRLWLVLSFFYWVQ